MKAIFEKKNSSFANIKSYLDTHLRVVHVVLIASEELFGRTEIMGLKI